MDEWEKEIREQFESADTNHLLTIIDGLREEAEKLKKENAALRQDIGIIDRVKQALEEISNKEPNFGDTSGPDDAYTATSDCLDECHNIARQALEGAKEDK